MTTPRFYMVWSPQGRAPTYRHRTYHDAKTEARRLARLNPGGQFIVLGALSAHATKDPVEDTTFAGSLSVPSPTADDDEIPF